MEDTCPVENTGDASVDLPECQTRPLRWDIILVIPFLVFLAEIIPAEYLTRKGKIIVLILGIFWVIALYHFLTYMMPHA